MATENGRSFANSEMIMPLAVVGILAIMIVPMPPFLMDLLISFDIVMSVVVLTSALYLTKPVQFSVFPSLLLLLTLYRLSLYIASSRLILLNGREGISAAGQVIKSFGQFVVGGNYVVGVIIFLIIISIQYIVINHGAVRISEVIARFTLDAMPGKQLSIDADLNAGLITEQEARLRRDMLTRESEFYGSMDGAIRFTSRDAIASIIITIINIVGGFIIGVMQLKMDLLQALQTYTILTVGDGLVTAIPALIMSVAGGIITTRAASESQIGKDLSVQLFTNPRPLSIAAGGLFLFILIPGLPKVAFLIIGAAAAAAAYYANTRMREREAVEDRARIEKAAKVAPPERVESLLKVDAVGLEVGYALIPLLDSAQGGQLLDRIKSIRRQVALDLGFVVPPIHITDNLQLGPREYSVLMRGVQIGRGELITDQFLAINPGVTREELPGIPTREPAFGLPALWIKSEQREKAQFAGYTVVDPTTVISTHISEIIKGYSHELLGRQETKGLLDTLAETHPKLVEELTPKLLSVGEIQKVLQNLLRERVTIRDLVTILETLADYGPTAKDVNLLTEYVRQALGRNICRQYQNEKGDLYLLTLSPEIEQALAKSITRTEQGTYMAIEPKMAQQLIGRIRKGLETALPSAASVLLVSSPIRYHLKRLTEKFLPHLAILSHAEVPSNVNVVSVGVIS
ncbi:MAG: flagellar biosynthesis protein FlhA [Acidobacteria bacterium]|nr:flagellar biosynthesis protein FlhA [Acidobacteriota bacterium]